MYMYICNMLVVGVGIVLVRELCVAGTVCL